MNNFWNGFSKEASVFGKLKPAINKAVKKNTDNVLDYRKINAPKAKPPAGPSLDYSKMKPPERVPVWKQKMEAKRQETIRNSPGVVDSLPKGQTRKQDLSWTDN